jgi:hypothetical protein
VQLPPGATQVPGVVWQVGGELQTFGLEPTHVPLLLHADDCVQPLPSSHGVPFPFTV